jgi:hypothetical protein
MGGDFNRGRNYYPGRLGLGYIDVVEFYPPQGNRCGHRVTDWGVAWTDHGMGGGLKKKTETKMLKQLYFYRNFVKEGNRCVKKEYVDCY